MKAKINMCPDGFKWHPKRYKCKKEYVRKEVVAAISQKRKRDEMDHASGMLHSTTLILYL